MLASLSAATAGGLSPRPTRSRGTSKSRFAGSMQQSAGYCRALTVCANMSSIVSPPLSLDGSFGCIFLAGIFSSILWGSETAQLLFYYNNFLKSDQLWLQLCLFGMYILDTTIQINVVVSLYVYLIKDFSNFFLLDHIERPITDSILLSAFVCVFVHSLYLIRIWYLSKRSYVLVIVLALLVTGQFVAVSIYFAQILGIRETTEFTSRPEMVTVRVMNGCVAVTDVTLSSVMAFLLHSQRSGVKRSDSLINCLILYIVGTGLLTACLALCALIFALVLPKTFAYLLIDILLPKLYMNSILALFNLRQRLRNDFAENSGRGISLGPVFANGRTAAERNALPLTNVTVVDTSVGTARRASDTPYGSEGSLYRKTRLATDGDSVE